MFRGFGDIFQDVNTTDVNTDGLMGKWHQMYKAAINFDAFKSQIYCPVEYCKLEQAAYEVSNSIWHAYLQLQEIWSWDPKAFQSMKPIMWSPRMDQSKRTNAMSIKSVQENSGSILSNIFIHIKVRGQYAKFKQFEFFYPLTLLSRYPFPC